MRRKCLIFEQTFTQKMENTIKHALSFDVISFGFLDVEEMLM